MSRSVVWRLRLEWVRAALLLAGAAVAGRAVLVRGVSMAAADRWLLVTGVVVAYEVGFLGHHLGRNRPEESLEGNQPGTVRPALGIANYVTLVRGGLFAAVAGFLFVPPATPTVAWAPGVCYGLGVALDAVDGVVARTAGRRTALGEKLDLAFDTVGFLVAPLVGVAWGRLPVWYLSVSAARYLYRVGLAWRERRGRPVFDLPESRVRRPLAALQMAFITVALLPPVPVDLVSPLAAVAATPSLAVFARDYLAVTGRIRRDEN